MANVEELHSFLTKLPNQRYKSDADFTSVLPDLLTQLGYNEDEIFYEVSIERSKNPDITIRPDAAIKADVESPVWFVITVNHTPDKLPWPGHRGEMKRVEQENLQAAKEQTDAKASIHLTNYMLTYIINGTFKAFHLENLSWGLVEEIVDDLQRPETLPRQGTIDELEVPPHGVYQGKYFEINLGEYRELLNDVKEASSSSEKGKALEEATEFLFESLDFFTTRRTRLNTTSSEVDLVLEYFPPDDSIILDQFGKFVMIECKNWDEPVGADEIRNFKSKMDTTRVDLGIIVATSGITGDSGKDAVDEMNQIYQRDGKVIISLDFSDLEKVLEEENLYRILDSRIFSRQFRAID